MAAVANTPIPIAAIHLLNFFGSLRALSGSSAFFGVVTVDVIRFLFPQNLHGSELVSTDL